MCIVEFHILFIEILYLMTLLCLIFLEKNLLAFLKNPSRFEENYKLGQISLLIDTNHFEDFGLKNDNRGFFSMVYRSTE